MKIKPIDIAITVLIGLGVYELLPDREHKDATLTNAAPAKTSNFDMVYGPEYKSNFIADNAVAFDCCNGTNQIRVTSVSGTWSNQQPKELDICDGWPDHWIETEFLDSEEKLVCVYQNYREFQKQADTACAATDSAVAGEKEIVHCKVMQQEADRWFDTFDRAIAKYNINKRVFTKGANK